MAMPPLISSSSNNQKQLGLTVSSNGYRNRSLSLAPSFINGGADQPVMSNNGASSNYSIQLHSSKFLSVVPSSFNGSGQQINQTNRSLSVVPSSFNGSGQQVNQANRRLSVLPNRFNGGDQQVINGVSLNHSSGMYRGLTLVPSFSDDERVMNNGIISSNYSSNQQELGFSVSSSNLQRNRNLSLVPSFNGYEPFMNTGVSSSNHVNRNHQNPSLSIVNMTGRRRSHVRNYQFSCSARLLTTREVLRARLISAFSTRRRVVINNEEAMYTRSSGPSFSSQINLNNSQQRRSRLTITELDEEACSDHNQTRCNNNGALALSLALDPTPVSICYPSRTNNENDDVENDDDGITHSLPYKKYGPYTCPRCLGKFPTSQTFAAHMGSHYKHETKAQRRRRLMAKIRRRNLRLHHSREGITLLPTEPVSQPQPTNMAEAEVEGDGALSIVQVKQEPADF